LIRFFISLAVTAAVVAGFVLWGVNDGWFEFPSFFLKTLIFLVFTTSVIFVYLYKANKPTFFLQLYLMTMVLKLLAYLGYNFIMILNDRASAVGNVVFFMVTYFLFTVVEIVFLYHKISGQNPSENEG
jgi:hypothetical protein